MKKIVLAGAAIAALASTAAIAQPQPREAGQALTRDAVAARVDARFAKLDANRDGAITQDELRARAEARRNGRGERRAEAFARLDADRDGSISRAEFDARPRLSREQRLERREDRAERRGARGQRRGGGLFARFGARHFQAADANRDGRVTQAEARQGALALFDRVDTDRSGTISQEERRAARQAFGGQRQQRRRG